MLNIDFIKEEKNKIEVRVWIEEKSNASDPTYIYDPQEVQDYVTEKIKEKYKSSTSYKILTDIKKLKNKMPAHLHSQNIKISLDKKQKKVKKTVNHKDS